MKYFLPLCLALLFTSCGSYKGEFAFKKPLDDAYRRISGPLEFSTEEKVQWIYKFHSRPGRKTIGAIYKKKELVWVDIKTEVTNIDGSEKIIYSTIEGFPAGEYQIILAEIKDDNIVFARRNFSIYTPEDSD